MHPDSKSAMKVPNRQTPTRQQGAALVVSLIILLVMTVIAISSMQSTTLDERMVGNMRDKGIALQAAESVLREGEEAAKAVSPLSFTGASGSNGYYAKDATIDVFSDATWTETKSIDYSGSLHIGESKEVAAEPRYILQYRGELPGGGLVTGSSYGSSARRHAVRTISRGNGLTSNTAVFLQSDSIVLH